MDMEQKLSFALAQINPIVGDLDGNCKKILQIWQQAKADLIVFPELALCGYPPEDLILKPFFLDKVEETLSQILEKSKNFKSGAIIGAPLRVKNKTYNAAHLIENGKILGTTKKHHLPNYGVFDEHRIFTSGPLPKPVKFRGQKLGLLICEDMWFPEPAKALKKAGAKTLIVINASPFNAEKHEKRLKLARARVKETGLPLAYVHQVGGQDELVFDGGSFKMDKKGHITAQAKFFEEDILLQEITSAPEPPERIYNALKTGLKDYIVKNNFPGIVLGLSGGIDSALSAVIAADALGAGKVHAVMMPSEFTSQDSLDDAQKLAQNLGIKYDIIPITQAFETLKNELKNFSGDIMEQNMQSRLRGLMLMAISNAEGRMVLSTGNKSEMAVGYATLYGDMNGGFNALKDVYKTQVYELCHWRNTQEATIPERILTKIPTAELKPNQTDQDTLPPYQELDAILKCLIEEDLGFEDIAARGHDPETIRKIWAMLDRAEYKRRQAPPGVKISAKSFGRERRYPITNKFTG